MRSPRSPRALLRPAALLLLLLPALTACSDGSEQGDGDGDPTTISTAAIAEGPLAVCREVMDERVAAVTEAARDASFEVLEAQMGDTVVTSEQIGRWHEAIAAHHDALAGARAAMAEAEVEPAGAWAELVASADEHLAILAERTELLAAGDWEAVEAGWPAVGATTGTPQEEVLEALDSVRRDCELVYSYPGNVTGHEEFVADAAWACATVVDRRRASGFEQEDRVYEALYQVRSGEPLDRDGLQEAVDAALVEWEETAADLGKVEAAGAPDPAAWETYLAAVRAAEARFRDRAEALRGEDEDRVIEVFTPGYGIDDGAPADLAALGLELRDCRSIAL